ncbi:MAG: putative undecaprenyl-phosphate glycosyl-phosphate transferase [Thermoleophilia bacterium]|nr:putative undecaprenyl-phosphate glycosyl-phosphate transferase [Thermoleophilia bacterium]
MTGRPQSGVARRPLQRAVKWVGDRVLAAVATIVLAPVLLGLALWVLFDAGWPILFVQRRTGRNGREFPMLKFRSMVNDAVRVGLELGVSDDPHGIVKDDPRITTSGRWLRRTSLDELPQLLNVLVGQMSLVGPRPDIPEQSVHYSEHDRRRLEVLPGVTGYSQVHGRDEIGWPERIAQDIYYIDRWSLWLDVTLIFQTFGVFRRGEPDPVLDTHNIDRARGDDTTDIDRARRDVPHQ